MMISLVIVIALYFCSVILLWPLVVHVTCAPEDLDVEDDQEPIIYSFG